MAQLNVTADKIQLTTNMITSAAEASEWDTDAKYPSAAAVKNAIVASAGAAVCDIANAVGSVVITSINTNPGDTLGGTWELIDKEYKNEFVHVSSQYWYIDYGVLKASASGLITRADHTICLKLRLTTTTPITSSANLGTIRRDLSGVTSNGSFSFSNEGGTAYAIDPATNTGYVVQYMLRGDGAISIEHIYGGQSLPTGTVINIHTIVPMDTEDMADAYCDKFYWKRTA
jgi:hypothetical protein